MEPLTAPLVLAAEAAIDLQMHTTYSDGTWQPAQLLDYLAEEQFGLAAVTDHDRVDSVAVVQALGAARGVPVLAAVEMSTSWRGEATDVLCYGFVPEPNALGELGQAVARRQEAIIQEVYEELRRRGYTLPPAQDVLQEQQKDALQTKDLEQRLVAQGYWTGPGSVWSIMTDAGFYFATNEIAAVVEAAHRSGAVCLIAHPGRGEFFMRYTADLLDELRREVPIDGLEAYYPAHGPEQIALYRDYARQHRLLVSAGSDSHGPENKPIKYRAVLFGDLFERLGVAVR
jgi:predicted metal-dependent phosphoesterase TrpH